METSYFKLSKCLKLELAGVCISLLRALIAGLSCVDEAHGGSSRERKDEPTDR